MSFLPEDIPLEEYSLVAHIFNKIYALLPLESDMSLIDVEDNKLYLSSRNSLVSISSSHMFNELLRYSIVAIDKINEHDNYLILKQRDYKSLASVLIVLRLLADLSKVHWDSKEPQRKNSIESASSGISINSSISVGIASASLDYHTVKPERLDSTLALRAIALVSKLKSTNRLAQELALINGKTIPQSNLYEDISTKPLIDQIDANCEAILRFLAASNPADFFDFTVSKLTVLKHNVANDTDFAPYLELFSAIYLDEKYLLEYLKHIRVIMTTIKKAAYRQLVLSFFMKAVKVWIYARPQEYLNCTKPDSNVSMEADILFDEMSALPDVPVTRMNSSPASGRQFKTSFRFLALLLTLNPKAFQSYLAGDSKSRGNALKKLTNFNMNKRQKVLTNVVKVLDQNQSKDASDNVSVLESLDFIVAIANVASSIYTFDPQNIVVQYSLAHYELVSRALVPINSSRSSPLIHNPNAIETHLLASLRLEYFSSLCIFNPKELIPSLIQILNDENASLDTLNLSCSILKVFSSTTAIKTSSQIPLILPALKKVMIRMGGLVKTSSYAASLNDDDEIISLNKTNSSNSTGNDPHPIQYKSMLNVDTSTATANSTSTPSKAQTESMRSPSTTSSVNSTSTPKSEKFKDLSKNLLKHHHSTSHVITQQISSHHSSDDIKSYNEKESILRSASLSRDILTNAFNIFKKHPHCYFLSFKELELTPTQKVGSLVENANELLEPLMIALNDANNKLVQAAKSFIQAFISITSIPDTSDHVVAAVLGCTLISNVLARVVSNLVSSDQRRKEVMEFFVKILEYRNSVMVLLEHHTHLQEVRAAENKAYRQLGPPIEQALLYTLCTPDFEIYSLTKRASRAFEIEFSANFPNLSTEDTANNEFYHAVSEDYRIITGNVALQKNIRKLFLLISKPSIAVINVWLRIYDKWYQLAHADYSELTQTELSEFRNYAGFLAAVSGIFVDEDTELTDYYTEDVRNDFIHKIDAFINQQFTMLGEENLVTRENAREILSSETNPLTYPKVITSLVGLVNLVSARSENLSQRDYNIIEHVITLLKAVLENGSSLIVFSLSTQLLHCVESLAKIVDGNSSINMDILKLRIKMSTLFSKVEVNNEKLVIQNAYKLRNRFLRMVYNWFEQAVTEDVEFGDPEKHKGVPMDFIHIDVAIESVRALALLLNDLVLEAPQVMNERELKFSKASLFSIYFNTFLKALEKYSDPESFPVSVRHKVSIVSENIVVCLTNLLKSNVDVGLSYALPIGYYTNLAIRVSFLKVFVSIVESYSKINSEASTDNRIKSVSLIFRMAIQDHHLLSSIGRSCPSSEAAALASCSQSLASSFNQSALVVSYLVEEEIKYATKYSDILRRNSFASRSLSAFGRFKGGKYLASTLRPILTEIRDSEAELEVEKIDSNDPNAEQNLNNFMHYLKKLVNVIIHSAETIPVEFRKVCKTIAAAVRAKFPDYTQIAVGSFIFLRFFCPAIVSPESEKIVDVPNRQTQRKFLLLTKVLQNMANGSVSSLRWPLLKSREEELNGLNDMVSQFLNDISVLDDDYTFEFTNVTELDANDYNFFHSYLYDNWQSIRAGYLRDNPTKQDAARLRAIASKIDEFLKIAGQPTVMFGYELPSSITPETNPELYDFMSKYSAQDLGAIVECPYVHQGISQDGNHLLVFSYHEYSQIQDQDEELILYRFIQVASKVWDHKFSFVIDCTGNDGSLLFPRRMMQILGSFAPDQMRENCKSVIYFNVSSGLYPSLVAALKSNDAFQNVPSAKFNFFSVANDRKTILNLGLSNTAMHLYSDVRVKFNDVSMYQPDQGRFVPVHLRIGNSSIQITETTPQRVKIRGDLKEIFLNDVFSLDKITNVAVTETTSVPNEITISFVGDKKVVLSSSKFLEIMRLLYFTKSRASGTGPENAFKQDAEKTLEDMLGQLFNVIFLGLTSSSAQVRSISYNLLAVSQKHFNLDLGRDIIQFPEVYFPRDSNSFVVSISEKLAISCPEITAELIAAFFKVYSDTITSRQRFAAILYVSPWIPNIYDYVLRADDEHGANQVTDIIRNFLSVSALDPQFLSAFNLSIFSKLCMEDRISGILVDEIVSSAIDREAEGSDWKSIISLLTSTPTYEICGHVIRKLRQISQIPFPTAKGTYNIQSHNNWTEITVLVQISVSLFFDCLQFAEMFLPDVFYIITILVDVGPLDLRTACHQLLLNTLQSFLGKQTISSDARSVIRSTVETLTSHRSRLLFGLNRDGADSFPTEISKFSTRIATMESLVASLMEIIEVAGTGDDKPVWISRWNRCVLDAALKDDCVLRGRALLLLGILSKGGVEDGLVCKVLEHVAEASGKGIQDQRYFYLAICTIFSLGRIAEGLLPHSKLYTKMFWFAIVLARSDLIALYQGGLQFITKTIESMNIKEQFINGDFITTIMDTKPVFGDLMVTVENVDHIYIDKDNIDQVLLHFAIKGLQLPYAKVQAVETLRTFFQIRFLNELLIATDEVNFNKAPLGYLLFLYLLLKPEDLRNILNDIDMSDDYIILDEQAHLPKLLADFLLSDSDQSNIAIHQAITYFNEGSPNEKTRLRLLLVLKHIGQRNPPTLMRNYYLLKSSLRTMTATTSLPTVLLTKIFSLGAMASVLPNYNNDLGMKAASDELLRKYKISGIDRYLFPNEGNLGTIAGLPSSLIGMKPERAALMKPFVERIYKTRSDNWLD